MLSFQFFSKIQGLSASESQYCKKSGHSLWAALFTTERENGKGNLLSPGSKGVCVTCFYFIDETNQRIDGSRQVFLNLTRLFHTHYSLWFHN